MNKTIVGLVAIVVVAVGLYWFTQIRDVDVPGVPGIPGVPDKSYVFAPEQCAFQARMVGHPEISSQLRGELTITSAKVVHSPQASVRVSCGPYIVMDKAALDEHLPKQMEFAARSAGLTDFKTDIRQQGDTLIATYEGMRGDGAGRKFLRSETHIRNNTFIEALYLVSMERSSDAYLNDLASVSAKNE